MTERLIRIRQIKPSDLPAVNAIEKASFTDPFPKRLLEALATFQPNLFLVATFESEIAGYASAILENGGEAHLLSLAVHPAHRRHRVGSRLLAEIIRRAKSIGARSMRLEVREANAAALRLYEAYGFSRVGTIPSYYADGENALTFRLDLTQQARRKPHWSQ